MSTTTARGRKPGTGARSARSAKTAGHNGTGTNGVARRRGPRTARNSDILELYEISVQSPEVECEFIDQVWRQRRRRLAHHVREDFCGTAIASVEWIRWRDTNTAIGVDIDPKVLAWAKSRLPQRLTPEQQKRLTLLRSDVLTARTRRVDCVLAMNFSYYLLKTRDELRRYFKRVRQGLVDDGLFLLDAYGGSEAFVEMEEKRRVGGFTYVWDQHHYNPITGDAINYIHYRFADGSQIRKAFTYEWRVWTLPEIRELLSEAGFRKVTVYWEGIDEKTGQGNDEFRPATEGDACPGWIAYIVAER